MRKGMATIIPIQLLSLFTWQELELNVCGKNKIDIQLLRENTRYQSGFSDEDEHVQMMWRVLESFTVRPAGPATFYIYIYLYKFFEGTGQANN